MFNFAVDPQRSGTSFEIFLRDMFGSSTKKQIFPFRPVSIDISGITRREQGQDGSESRAKRSSQHVESQTQFFCRIRST
jgi:hypothetical protein